MKRVGVLILLSLVLGPSAHATFWEDNWSNENIGVSQGCGNQACLDGCPTACPLVCTATPAATYRTFHGIDTCSEPTPNRCLDVDSNQLYFHGEDYWPGGTIHEGFPLIKSQADSRDFYLSAEIAARSYCSQIDDETQCFFGLTWYNGECDYVEIAFQSIFGTSSNQLVAYFPETSFALGPEFSQDETHKIRLDYYGDETTSSGRTWVLLMDDVIYYAIHDTDHRLNDDPRIALFFASMPGGTYVEGHAGPLRTWTADTIDQAQLSHVSATSVSQSTWIAQEVHMTADEYDRVQLDLVTGNYQIGAYTDQGGAPGDLINETPWLTDRNGLQYVPLRVPSLHKRLWIVIKANSIAPNGLNVGTSPNNTNPYSGMFKSSTNSGVTWQSQSRDLYFLVTTRS